MAVVPKGLRTSNGDGASMRISREDAMAKVPLMESDVETAAEASVETSHEPVGRSVAPLPGQWHHHCTDPCWILLLIAAVGVLYFPIQEAMQTGDMSKYMRGFDYMGRMCGRDECAPGQICGRFIYFCSKVEENGIDTLHPICVDSCPTNNLTSHVCFDSDTQSTLLVPDWPTEEFNMKCLQRSHRLRAEEEHERKRLAGDVTRFKGGAGHTPGILLDCIASIARARLHLVVVIFVSTAAGFMYMLFLWSCLKFLIYGSLVLVILIPSSFGLWHLFIVYRGGGVTAALSGNLQIQQSLWMGLAGVSIGLFLWCTLKQIFNRIQTAEGCIMATTECLFELPFVLLEPAFSLLAKVMIALPLFILMLEYASTGEMQLIATERGIHRHLQLRKEQWGIIFYFAFLIAWTLELVHNMTQYILAFIAQRWYFTPYVGEQKVDVPGICVTFESTCNLFRYHFGSVVFGSLLKTLFRIPKMFAYSIFLLGCCKYSKHKEVKESSGTKFTASLMFALLRKEGYMDMAITSSDYCEATEHATFTLDDSSTELVLTWTQIIFELGGWVLMTGVGALYMAVTVHSNPRFTDATDDEMFLKEPDAVVALAGVLGLAVGVSFMNVFDVIGDTILYCLALEEQRFTQLRNASNPHHKDDATLIERWEGLTNKVLSLVFCIEAGAFTPRCTCRDSSSGGFLSWMMGYDEYEQDL